MIKIAITGSIASGKTYVATIIENLGYKVFYADKFVDSLYKSKSFQAEIKKLFYGISHVAKPKIAKLIFNSEIDRKKLEALIHPYVIEGLEGFFDEKLAENMDIIFAEIPLLFEKKMNLLFDYVITVICPEKIRQKRALQRKNMDLELYEKIISLQMPDSDKIKLSDFVLQSNVNELNLKKSIITLLKELKASARDNTGY